jgi:2,3-bisphosphoglycerate-independent phosphoglycerate mutase
LKVVLIVLDGLGDRRCKTLGLRTPLQAARPCFFDKLAAEGETGLIHVVAPGLPNGSDTGHLALLGYDPHTYYTGRGPFEALGAGVELREGDVAFRCNFGTVSDDLVLIDRRAGRISSAEAKELAADLQKISVDGVEIVFRHTVEHRGVLVLRGEGLSHKVSNVDPHGVYVKIKHAQPLEDSEAALKTAKVLNTFLQESRRILAKHPVNIRRREQGLPPANYVLTRGAGIAPKIPPFEQRFRLKPAVIAGGALYKGVAKVLGFEVMDVEGATGTVSTNVEGKARAMVDGLKKYDFILLHYKAPLTVEAIIRKMPLEGFIARWDTAVYIITDIARGVEKHTPRLAAGEIFYWSPERVVGIAVKNHISRPQTVKVGAVIGDYGVLSSARTGARIRFVLEDFLAFFGFFSSGAGAAAFS